MIPARLSVSRRRAISADTRPARSRLGVTRIADASTSCSAWASKSAAASAGSASSSAIIMVSVGPGSPSIPTSPYTCCLASVTNRLPGPTIFATRGTLSVP